MFNLSSWTTSGKKQFFLNLIRRKLVYFEEEYRKQSDLYELGNINTLLKFKSDIKI